ncbi:MAG TPA: YceI family protein [Luteitalea sp.]|nr:YceI family protein [Luteitalea sp.]
MHSSSVIRFALGALALAAATITPLLGQERAPLSLTGATITLAGTSNLHDYTASTTSVRVTKLQVAPGADLASLIKPGTVQAFEIAIPAASLHSTRDGLDKNMHKALKAKDFPEIVFTLSRLESRAAGLRAIGVLKIAGVEKEVGFDITTATRTGSVVVSGAVDLLMTDFGIPAPKAVMGMLKTDPKVTISFETTLSTPLT